MPILKRSAHRPRDSELFDLLEAAAANVRRAASLLDELLSNYPDRADLARDILICEQEGDRLTHGVYQHVNQHPPEALERHDVHELAAALDDVVDYVEEVADFLGLYKIEAPMEQAQQLARILLDACREIEKALPKLRTGADYSHETVEINRLENDGDRVTREALASLFEGGIDPMVVIRWKDLFERLEAAIDATERVANTLDGIALKRS
ncbi:DUF47 domain-containing protein [Thermoleophilum album]|uniref:TIGR00153 family protein n=1 Tax=Thermoleophilum album TaxID=29539 RepID=A0A1H6FXZ0_THEAL|nr:DUF47 family protein [Thermoleophilum album]SEH15048.1 hypothetical protein SAMN02745716_1822 [Thermoleophilum album]